MLTAVLVAVPAALALVVAALPVVLVPIAMAAKRPPGVARAFLVGWLLGILLVGALVIALIDVLVLPSGETIWFAYAKIVLGLLLVVLMLVRPQGLFGTREIWDVLPRWLPRRRGTKGVPQ